MRQFDDEQIERMCGRKKSYSKLKLARTVKNKLERYGHKKNSLRIYLCPICSEYHITHTK